MHKAKESSSGRRKELRGPPSWGLVKSHIRAGDAAVHIPESQLDPPAALSMATERRNGPGQWELTMTRALSQQRTGHTGRQKSWQMTPEGMREMVGTGMSTNCSVWNVFGSWGTQTWKNTPLMIMSKREIWTMTHYLILGNTFVGFLGGMVLWLYVKKGPYLIETHGKYFQRECYVILDCFKLTQTEAQGWRNNWKGAGD